jgi:hypothetical protein
LGHFAFDFCGWSDDNSATVAIEQELRAYASFAALLTKVEECRGLFDEAGLAYPEPLQRMLGHLTGLMMNGAMAPRPSIHIDPPPAPPRPPGVGDGWIWVPINVLTAQVCVLAVLRAADGAPVPVRQIKSEVISRGSSSNDGSILNIGTRLEDAGTIARAKDGWRLLDLSKAPILNGKYAWGTEEMFSKNEIAARRRDGIVHVLGCFRDGLQSAQILTQLQDCPWFKGPLNKDQLKLDLEELKKAQRIRRGMQRKWIVVANAEHR